MRAFSTRTFFSVHTTRYRGTKFNSPRGRFARRAFLTVASGKMAAGKELASGSKRKKEKKENMSVTASSSQKCQLLLASFFVFILFSGENSANFEMLVNYKEDWAALLTWRDGR